MRYLFLLPVIGLSLALVRPAQAQFTPIGSPESGYLSITNLINFSGLTNGTTNNTSITDGTLTVGFSQNARKAQVPGSGWSTWSSPPNAETSTPHVLVFSSQYTNPGPVTFSFSQSVSTFGFELEPNNFAVYNINADFYNGATLLGSISQNVNGNAGARLFGASDPLGFTSVVVTPASQASGFASAQYRYSLTGTAVVPEPGEWAVMGMGALSVGGLLLRARRRR
jgi:hypothetical protein